MQIVGRMKVVEKFPKTLAGLVLVCGSLLMACGGAPVTKVSSSSGKQGSPPLCFDYRGEAQATGNTGISNIWAYLNNTCGYPVNCVIHNDVTDKDQQVGVIAYRQLRVLLAQGVPATRVRLKLECSWDP